MGYVSALQVIQRRGGNRQYYVICPAPLAEALELRKGEPIEWVVEDRNHLLLLRGTASTEKERK
jgi:bifunctional DNA-binding transcriptional regulator/antitoxin component of YhaV-PrlF toxin-antitoxin module